MKTTDLSLEDLYAKPKITPSIEAAIILKEDFTEIQSNYCDKICRLTCKSYAAVDLNHDEVDIMILQDHNAYDDGYKEGYKIEQTHRRILSELAKQHFDGLSWKISNVLKCNLDRQDLVKNKPPTVVKQLKCAPYLLKEIQLSKPRVIVSLTSNATKALGIRKSNYTNRGEIHGNVVLTLHPKVTMMIRQNSSGKMWGPDYWEVINRDFEKAAKMAHGKLKIPDLDEAINREKENIHIAKSIDDVKEFARIIASQPASKIRSFDTETTGLDPLSEDAKLITIQFGFRDADGRVHAYVFPLWHRDNIWYNPDEAWNTYIKPLLEDDSPKVGHNVKFDVLYIFFTTGVRVKNIVFDTMLILHNINSGIQGNYSLKRAVWDWLPESGLGGYEDKLPTLSTIDEEDESEETSSDVK
jgi:uracil-DNA glycosylase family 4